MPDQLDLLEHGPLYRFADWPNPAVPTIAAGVYTIWENQRFIYVGMAGRGLTVDQLAEKRRVGARPTGLWSRLNSHASGRRSGDQFCVYVADRLVLPTLNLAVIQEISAGLASMDQLARDYIRGRLSYRFVETPDGITAVLLERSIQSGVLSVGQPALNPR